MLSCPFVSQVTKEDEFFSLSHCQLLELISQDSLKVLCESEVCGIEKAQTWQTSIQFILVLVDGLNWLKGSKLWVKSDASTTMTKNCETHRHVYYH